MTDESQVERRRNNGKGGNGSYNIAFYAIIASTVAMIAVVFALGIGGDQMSFDDLMRLIADSAPAAGTAATAPEVEVATPRGRVVYRKLDDLRIGPTTVSGKVERQLPDAQNPEDRAPKTVSFWTNKSDSSEVDRRLLDALAKASPKIHHDFVPTHGFWKAYGPALFVSCILVFLFIFMMRKLAGAGSPMAFGRSRGRLYAQEDLGVTFDDVAGIQEAVEEVKEIVDFLRSPEKYQRLGGRIPKGVLLVGPPGTGKTLLARAIAGEAGVPFFSLSGSDFVEMFVGVGAARVRDMFEQAVAKAPCIIFIDELDALGKTRGTSGVGGHDEREQTLNALLVEMDGFDANAGVIVMAATNRPEMLDQALLRPGRFDRQVLVDRPDVRGREDILKVHVKQVKLEADLDLAEIAAITPGFAGADLANLVNEAALLAARAEKSAVGMRDFNEGVERLMAGLEKKQRIMNGDEKQRVAYHEAGHALVACSLPNTDPVHKVSIIPRGFAALGYTLQRPDGDRYLMTQSELESRIQVLLAGTMAEEIIFQDVSTGAQNDLERATEIARGMVMDYGMSRLGRIAFRESAPSIFLSPNQDERRSVHSEHTAREIDQEVKRILDESLARVREIILSRRPALEALSQRLIQVESIEADELHQIIADHSASPRVVPGTEAGTKKSPAAGPSAEGSSGRSAGDATAP